MKTLSEKQKELLDAPLPSAAVKPHPTKPYLSTIKSIYVSERINEVFGVGSWNLESEIIEHDKKMVVLKVTLVIEEYGIKLSHYGGNDNADKGDAFKGAMSDALTKIAAVYLGIGANVFKGIKSAPPKSKPAPKPKTIDYSNFKEANLNDVLKVYASKDVPPIDKIKAYIRGFKNISDKYKTDIIQIDNRLDIFGNN